MIARELYERSIADPSCDTQKHLPFLRSSAKGNVLEIGVRGGVSTSALLLGVGDNGGHVYSIDINPECLHTFEGHPQWTFRCLNSHNPSEVMRMIFGPDADEVLAGKKECRVLDLMFLDASHEYEPTLYELRTYSPIMKHGSLMTMHDVEGGMYPGCQKAMQDFLTETGWKGEVRPGSWGLGVIQVP